MLTGGSAPGLPGWPIRRIKLQGRYAGYLTDDFIVYVAEPNGGRAAKLLGQIKQTVAITARSTVLAKVLAAGWADFQNTKLFDPATDVLALITGPLSQTVIDHVREPLDWARGSETAAEFMQKLAADGHGQPKRHKMQVLRTHLDNANNGPLTMSNSGAF
jgi:hypothetical protein